MLPRKEGPRRCKPPQLDVQNSRRGLSPLGVFSFCTLLTTALCQSDHGPRNPDHGARYVSHNASNFGQYYHKLVDSSSLPSFEDSYLNHSYPTQRPMCSNLSFDDPVQGQFYRDKQGYASFELDACQLNRMSAEQVRSCFSGKRIAFFGDSVVRYQFLALVHFLSKGVYDHPYDGATNGSTFEAQWGDWNAFYPGVTAKLRTPGVTNGTLKFHRSTASPEQNTEEWEFVIQIPGSPAKIWLDMMFVTVWPTLSKAASIALNFVFHPSKPKPEIVVYNMAHWWAWAHPATQSGRLSEVLGEFEGAFREALGKVSRGGTTKLIYRTHTVPDPKGDPRWVNRWWYNNWGPVEAMVKPLARFYKFSIYDAGAILNQAIRQGMHPYHDTVHPLHFMWEQFNDLLFNVICPMNGTAGGGSSAVAAGSGDADNSTASGGGNGTANSTAANSSSTS